MATFTVDPDNNITACAGVPAAAENLQAFSSAEQLAKLTAEWPASRLVETWNSFAGVAPFDDLKPVKKFTSRKVAVTRIWEAVQCPSADAAPQATPVPTETRRSKKTPAKISRRLRAPKGTVTSCPGCRAPSRCAGIAYVKVGPRLGKPSVRST